MAVMDAEGRGARPYRSPARAERARRTRRAVLAAAREVFTAHGYAATTVRAVAAEAGVSAATVELLFGTKAALVKAAADVAIAGDDEPVPMLDRDWARDASLATTPEAAIAAAVRTIGPAQERSAGLVLAILEGSAADVELAEVADRMVEQRAVTAGWIVDLLAGLAPLRPGLSRADAVDTVWLLMEPSIFDRLTRRRGWSTARYQEWLASTMRTLLFPDPPSTDPPSTDPAPGGSP